MRTTEVKTHKSQKRRRCHWCAERIEIGETYKRYRCFDGGDATTCQLHPECLSAADDLADREGPFEFHPGDQPRGCNCEFDSACGCWMTNEELNDD